MKSVALSTREADSIDNAFYFTGWWDAPFTGLPWVGQASAGRSGDAARALVAGRDLGIGHLPTHPTIGAPLNGHATADFDGTAWAWDSNWLEPGETQAIYTDWMDYVWDLRFRDPVKAALMEPATFDWYEERDLAQVAQYEGMTQPYRGEQIDYAITMLVCPRTVPAPHFGTSDGDGYYDPNLICNDGANFAISISTAGVVATVRDDNFGDIGVRVPIAPTVDEWMLVEFRTSCPPAPVAWKHINDQWFPPMGTIDLRVNRGPWFKRDFSFPPYELRPDALIIGANYRAGTGNDSQAYYDGRIAGIMIADHFMSDEIASKIYTSYLQPRYDLQF